MRHFLNCLALKAVVKPSIQFPPKISESIAVDEIISAFFDTFPWINRLKLLEVKMCQLLINPWLDVETSRKQISIQLERKFRLVLFQPVLSVWRHHLGFAVLICNN